MGTLTMGLFLKYVFYWEENGKTKILFRKRMHFKQGLVNTIKYNLFFTLDILNTEVFRYVSGAVNSIFCLALGKNNLHCQIWFPNFPR